MPRSVADNQADTGGTRLGAGYISSVWTYTHRFLHGHIVITLIISDPQPTATLRAFTLYTKLCDPITESRPNPPVRCRAKSLDENRPAFFSPSSSSSFISRSGTPSVKLLWPEPEMALHSTRLECRLRRMAMVRPTKQPTTTTAPRKSPMLFRKGKIPACALHMPVAITTGDQAYRFPKLLMIHSIGAGKLTMVTQVKSLMCSPVRCCTNEE